MKDRARKLALLELLCSRAGCVHALDCIRADMTMEDMPDGGMGSFRILHPAVGEVHWTLATADYIDADGIPISIALLGDETRNPSEVDLAKGDFSRVVEYPVVTKLSNFAP